MSRIIADILIDALSGRLSGKEASTLRTEFVKLGQQVGSVTRIVGGSGGGGTIIRSGEIAGWDISENGIYSKDGEVGLSSFPDLKFYMGTATYLDEAGIWMGAYRGDYVMQVGDPDANLLNWDGTDLTITGTLYASAGEIGGWTIGTSTIEGGNLILDSDGSIYSSDYASYASGWKIDDDGTAEFNNVYVRGEIHASVFVKDLIEAHAGTLLVGKSAGKLALEMDVPASGTWTMYIGDPPGGGFLFSNSDICRIKWITSSGTTYQTWFTLSGATDMGDGTQRYTCTYNSGSRGGALATTGYPAGLVVVDYGTSGQGYLLMTADLSGAPFYDVRTHAGAPWTTETVKTRLGNLSGVSDPDLSPSGYGLYSDNVFLKGDLISNYVTINNSGIQIALTTSYQDNRKLRFFESTTERSNLGAFTHSTVNVVSLNTLVKSGAESRVILYAEGPSNAGSYAAMAAHDQVDTSSIYVHTDSAGGNSRIDVQAEDDIRIRSNSGIINLGWVSGDVKVWKDIYTDEWQEYTGTTINGWSGTPSGGVYYRRLGKLVFVMVYLSGTSNYSGCNFTVPYQPNTVAPITCVRFTDNSVVSSTPGYAAGNISDKIIAVYTTWNGGSWTASGTKTIYLEFLYHTNDA